MTCLLKFYSNFYNSPFRSDLNVIFLRYDHSIWRKKEMVSWRFVKSACVSWAELSWPPVVTRNQLGCNGDSSTVHSKDLYSTHYSTAVLKTLYCSGKAGLLLVAQSELNDLDHHQLTAPPRPLIGQSSSNLGYDWWKVSHSDTVMEYPQPAGVL